MKLESVRVVTGDIGAVGGYDIGKAGETVQHPRQHPIRKNEMGVVDVVSIFGDQLLHFWECRHQIRQHFVRVADIGPFPAGGQSVDFNAIHSFGIR